MSTSTTRRKLQDPRVVRRLAAALLSGATVTEALRRADVSRSTFYRELHRSPDLRALSNGKKAVAAETARPVPAKRNATAAGSPPAGQPVDERPRAAARTSRAGTEPEAVPPTEVTSPRKRPRGSRRARSPEQESKPGRRTAPRPGTTQPAADLPIAATAADAPVAAPAPQVENADVAQPLAAEVQPLTAPTSERRRLSTLVRNPYTIRGPLRDRAGAALASVRDRAFVRPRAGKAPSGGDWMPPAVALGLQLIVAIAVGAHPLVILLIAGSTLGALLFVRRARRLAPKPRNVQAVRFTARNVGPLETDASTNGDSLPGSGEHRPMDLRWVAATILPARPSPDDPAPPRTRT